MNINTIAAAKRETILKMAKDNNFWGKRLRDKKLVLAESIAMEIFGNIHHSSAICDWLDENKPVAPAVTRRVAKVAKEDSRPVAAGAMNNAVESWKVIDGKRFILTSIQNNTFPHKNFLESLKQAALYYDAELLVSKYAYNKKGFKAGGANNEVRESDNNSELHYDSAFEEFILNENVFLHDRDSRFAFMAEINIIPTADFPLSGFAETVAALELEGVAIGHAKITAESVPALKGEKVARMYSTGTATLKNYIQQKAGQKAEALHNFGALLVEFDEDGEFFCRQLETMDDSGMFFDLNVAFSPAGAAYAGGNVLALQYGDIHAEKLDNECAFASWGGGDSLVDYLKPKYQIVHDVHDFTSRNHHNRQSGVFLATQYALGRDKVVDDLKDTGNVLASMERTYSQTVIVESNHDLALSRWLDDPKCNIKQDPANAELYYSLNAAQYKAIAEGNDTFNMLDHAIRTVAGIDVSATFLETDQSFKLAGIECGAHGHNGINGARGNPKGFRKLGKMNTGHTHTASIYGGIYTAGVTGSLDMGYNIGASSWSQTHIITYENGQRTLIDFKNGKFFA